MSFSVFIWLALFASLSSTSAVSVIVGDEIDFTCVTEERDEIEFLPTFQRKDDEGNWLTLFIGSNPRPETDLDKWVEVDEGGIFTYSLLSATLADAGHYRCDNINETSHSLMVVSDSLECGTVDDLVCKVKTVGPSMEDDEVPLLQWVVGTHDFVERNLTSNSSASSAEAALVEELTNEFHGKVISCLLDHPMRKTMKTPNCVVGPLNITFDVKVGSFNQIHEDGCDKYEIVLIGNPRPLWQLVEVGVSVEGLVDYGVEEVDDDVVVYLRLKNCDAKNMDSDVLVDVLYDKVVLKSFKFSGGVATEATETPVAVPELNKASGGNGAVIGAVLAILVIVIVGVASYFIVKRRRGEKNFDVESGEEKEEKEKKEEAEKEEKEEAEKEEKEVEKEEVEKEEKEEAEKEEKEEAEKEEKEEAEKEEAENVKDPEAEAEKELRAKLSVLDDVEGVIMIDDSLNEGKDDPEDSTPSSPKTDNDNVEV